MKTMIMIILATIHNRMKMAENKDKNKRNYKDLISTNHCFY